MGSPFSVVVKMTTKVSIHLPYEAFSMMFTIETTWESDLRLVYYSITRNRLLLTSRPLFMSDTVLSRISSLTFSIVLADWTHTELVESLAPDLINLPSSCGVIALQVRSSEKDAFANAPWSASLDQVQTVLTDQDLTLQDVSVDEKQSLNFPAQPIILVPDPPNTSVSNENGVEISSVRIHSAVPLTLQQYATKLQPITALCHQSTEWQQLDMTFPQSPTPQQLSLWRAITFLPEYLKDKMQVDSFDALDAFDFVLIRCIHQIREEWWKACDDLSQLLRCEVMFPLLIYLEFYVAHQEGCDDLSTVTQIINDIQNIFRCTMSFQIA